jgi:LysM repeat protein
MTIPDATADAPTEHLSRGERIRRINPATKYAVVVLVLALLAIAGLFIEHAVNTVPRDSLTDADRELRVNVIAPGEHVVQSIPVFKREAVDYFRATRGELVLTDRRMIFLGLRPRDLLSPADAPPAFDERDFPLDTLVSVTSGHSLAGLAKAVVIRTPTETVRLAVAGPSWPEAVKMVSMMEGRQRVAQAQGVSQESMRKRADAEWTKAVASWKKAQTYTVQRGDALGGIATDWNTTPEQLQRLNHLPDNRIRVGQTLLVRQGT